MSTTRRYHGKESSSETTTHLIAAIADGAVVHVPARRAQGPDDGVVDDAAPNALEGVMGVVSVFGADQTAHAQREIITDGALDHPVLLVVWSVEISNGTRTSPLLPPFSIGGGGKREGGHHTHFGGIDDSIVSATEPATP